VKEHRFVNHSKEYAKDGVHVNIHHSVPDGLEMSEPAYLNGHYT